MKTIHTDIVIVGAGLTGLTMAYYLKKSGVKIMVLDKNAQVGGVIKTFSEKGFTYEAGPNTGVISSPELVQLFQELNLQFEVPGAAAKERWIWKDGSWHALPSGLVAAIKTSLFTFKDKINILGEPFRECGDDPDETVGDLVRRRMGTSFLTYAVDPFISGIYAGDPDKLVTRFALPKLHNLEQRYGSFVRGSMKKRKEPKTALEKQVTKEVFSVRGGLSMLVTALKKVVDDEAFVLSATDIQIGYHDNKYVVRYTKEGEEQSINADKVITTVDGLSLPALLPFLAKEVISKVAHIRYAKVVQVVVGYNQWNGIELNAFGGLVPSAEKKDVLGILFPSALFENRAPEGGALLSIFMGGIKRPDIIEKSDEEIIQIATNAIKEMMHAGNKPDLIKIFRYEKAIPQYEHSSGLRLFSIMELEKAHPGLILAGNVRDGIGMSDRVKQAKMIVEQVLTEIKG
jgi:oxygen-dependent protoporphyrinogen oxidase